MQILFKKFFLTIRRYWIRGAVPLIIYLLLYIIKLIFEEFINPIIVQLTGFLGDFIRLMTKNPLSILLVIFALVTLCFVLLSTKIPTWDFVNITPWNPLMMRMIQIENSENINYRNGIRIENNSGEDLKEFRADLLYISILYDERREEDIAKRYRDFLSKELLPSRLFAIEDSRLVEKNITIRNGGEAIIGLCYEDKNNNDFIRSKKISFLKPIVNKGYVNIRLIARYGDIALPPKIIKVYLEEENKIILATRIEYLKNN